MKVKKFSNLKFRTKIIAWIVVSVLLLTGISIVPADITNKSGTDDSGDSWDGPTSGVIRVSGSGRVWEATAANIQLAIWSLNATGGELHLSGGVIESSTYINITCSNIIIEGHGTTLRATGDVGAWGMLYSWNQNNITIKNLILDANNTARRTLYLKGTTNLEGFTIDNVETKNTMSGYIWNALTIGTTEDHVVDRVKITDSYFHNHSESSKDNFVIGRTNNLIITGCTFENIGKNILIYGGLDSKISSNDFDNVSKINIQSDNCLFYGNTLNSTYIVIDAFTADGGTDASDTNHVKVDCNSLENGFIAVYPSNSDYSIFYPEIIGNSIIFNPKQTTGSSYGIIMQHMNSGSIKNNKIIGASRAGVTLYNSSNITLEGNLFVDNAGNTSLSSRASVLDFGVDKPCDNITIKNNKFKGEDVTILYHVWLRGNDSIVYDNEFLGTFTTAYKSDGLRNRIFNNDGYETVFPTFNVSTFRLGGAYISGSGLMVNTSNGWVNLTATNGGNIFDQDLNSTDGPTTREGEPYIILPTCNIVSSKR